jgi:IS605 OrfB family transposase
VNRYGVIAVEDLNIKGLSSGMLARSVNDAGWNSFFSKIAYKAECAGREMVKVTRAEPASFAFVAQACRKLSRSAGTSAPLAGCPSSVM